MPIKEPEELQIDEAYEGWRQVWDLDSMSLRDIYNAGFRHGFEEAQKR